MIQCPACGSETAETEESCSNCGAATAVSDHVEEQVPMAVSTNSGQGVPDLETNEGQPIAEPSEPSNNEPLSEKKGSTSDLDVDLPQAQTTDVKSTETDGKRAGMRALASGTILNNRY